MWCGISGYSDAEMIGVLFAYVLDEIVCVLEVVGLGFGF